MLFKDEVRAVAAELGLPERIVWRQPFPGPGLAIRIVGGEVNRERLDILRDADAILQEEIRAAELYRELWQSFCVLPVVRSVGVQGDGRTYAYPIVIRAVTSDDAMTADWARLPYDLLERVSNRIINEVPGSTGSRSTSPRSPRRRSSGNNRTTLAPRPRQLLARAPGRGSAKNRPRRTTRAIDSKRERRTWREWSKRRTGRELCTQPISSVAAGPALQPRGEPGVSRSPARPGCGRR